MMDNKTIDYLIDLNKSFYRKLGGESVRKKFSDTRKSSWIGWDKLATVIDENKGFRIKSVLDIGCGNGRFYKELIENRNWAKVLAPDFKYIGVDTDLDMLSKARNQYSQATFVAKDIINNAENSFVDKFDLVVSFGVAHHVPSANLRIDWFKSLTNSLNSGGFLAITLWNFINTVQFNNRDFHINSSINLDDNDYFLGWDNEPNLYRYCHYYDEKEIDSIMKSLKSVGLEQLSIYFEDGKDRTLNRYLVFKRDGS